MSRSSRDELQFGDGSRDVDLDQLLSAYALGAIDDEERRAVEHYLTTNATARAEVASLERAAKSLEYLRDPSSDQI